MAGPMCVNGTTGMVVRRVVIRMLMDERSGQDRSLKGKAQRDGNGLLHRTSQLLAPRPMTSRPTAAVQSVSSFAT